MPRSDKSRCRRLHFERLEPRATPTADVFTNMVDEMMEQAPTVAPSASYFLKLMRADGSFSDLHYQGTSDASAADLQLHGLRLEALSLAYKWSDSSNTYFNSPTLKSEILQSWNYIATKAGSVNAPNWWWKAIGVPQGMSDGLVLMRSEMAANVRSQILTKYFGTVWQPLKMDGANLAYQAPMAMVQGLLKGDTGRIRDVVSKISSELTAYSGEGIQRDLSFYQHRAGGKFDYYSGSYGLVFARDTSRVMRWVNGTSYAFGTAAVDQEVRFVVEGLAWLTRGDTLDIPSQGRSITRPGWPTNAPYILRNAMADLAPLGRRTGDLLDGIDRYDNGISDTNALSGNQSLWKGDAMVNQRPEMLTTVKMISNRTARPETAAGENTKGFFEGDGFTMFVQDGDEFGSRGGPNIMPVWDWQRLPGTTVEHNGSIPSYDMFKTATNSTGSSSLVGSASDGQYGVAAMDYQRSGVSVTARKAWFFFDNEVVALGAAINDPGGRAPVFTSLNQVLLDGDVTVQDAAGRRTLSLGGSATLSGGSWIEHDGLGYVVLDGSDKTTVQAQFQKGANGLSLPVFSAWIDHGSQPKNATYAYAVVPGVTPDTLASYAQALPITILANTATVQAVQQVDLKQTQVAFYAAGSVQIAPGLTVSVDQPADMIIKQVGNDLIITASDPRQTASSLAITVSRHLTGSGVTLSADGNSSRITFALPTAPYQGSSITRTFHIAESVSSSLAEGEAAAAHGTAITGLFSGSGSAGVGSLLSSQSRATVVRQAAPAAPTATPVASGRLVPATASGDRLGRGHGPWLNSDIIGALSADAALEVWGDPLDL